MLKWLWWALLALAALAALAVAGIAAGRLGLLRGSPPADLGVRDGRLKAPSDKPNSVSSQADLWPGHPQLAYARIAPLAAGPGGIAVTMAKLAALVTATPGAVVVKSEPGYLYAQYTTPLMKYTDDVEFWLDPVAGVVQVRSASRLGYSDRGLNRQRVEAMRAQLAAP